jgi:branched-chain amino acid transport system permease protein
VHVLLEYLIEGLVVGAIYFITASGLVVTYTTSGVFNFAHGALGMVAAFSYWALRVGLGWPPIPAVIVVVCIGAPLAGALIERGLIRRLQGAPTLATIAATIGLLLALVGGAQLLWNPQVSRSLPSFFNQTSSIGVAGVRIAYDELLAMIVAVVVAVGMWVLLHRTRAGVGMRAVVDDPELLALSGVSPARAAQAGWMLGAALAAAAGILLATDPVLGSTLDIPTLTLLVINGYAAAVMGRLRSLPLTFLGAMVLGAALQISQGEMPSSWQQNLQPGNTLPMVLLFVILLALPQGRLRTARKVPALRLSVASLRSSLAGAGVIVLAGVVASRLLPSSDITIVSMGVAFGIIMLSLIPLTGYAGQISCCQLTFAGLGAFAMGKLAGGDSPLGLLAAIGLAAAVGALVALPAIRFQGLYLALGTLAFAAAMDYAFFGSSHFGGVGGFVTVGRAPIFGLSFASNRAYLVLLAVVFALAAMGVLALRRSRFGRRLVALNDSPAASATAGIQIGRTKLAVFSLSAGLAGLGGALFGGVSFTVQQSDFPLLASLTLLLLATVWGIRSVSGVLLGGLTFFVLPHLINDNVTYLYLLTGVGAVGISRNPEGVVGDLLARLSRMAAKRGPGLAPGGSAQPAVTNTKEAAGVAH